MSRVDELYIESAKNILENGYKENEAENSLVRAKWDGKEAAYAIYLPQQITTYKAGEVPIINLRKIPWKSGIKEILWIYQDASNDVNLLKEKYNVHYWDEWQNKEGNLGKSYGYQIAKSIKSPETGKMTTQIKRVIDELRNNPLNRRIFMSMMDMEDLADMTLIPCAFMTMWTVAGKKLNLTLIQRSGDFLAAAGPGSVNAFQYYALLRMVAQVTGYEAGEFMHFVQNLHIYDRHIETVKSISQIELKEESQPKLLLNPGIKEFEDFTIEDFTLEDYHPDDKKYNIDIAV